MHAQILDIANIRLLCDSKKLKNYVRIKIEFWIFGVESSKHRFS